MFPAATALRPSACSISVMRPVTVDLPLVPVTATRVLSSTDAANSTSDITWNPAARASRTSSECSGTPGLTTTRSTRSSKSADHSPAAVG